MLIPLIATLSLIFGAAMPIEEIAKKIWKNECNGTVEGLVSWNAGEEFASLGIGHFIWYPSGQQGPFKETFPELLQYLKEHHIALPGWLENADGFPWNTRQEFLKQKDTAKIESLRSLLAKTVSLQAQFILKRFEATVSELKHAVAKEKQTHIEEQLKRLLATAKGQYALIDYLNFKGTGTDPKERYQGEGWGLCQVLELMPGTGEDPLQEFIAAAKTLLQRRVDLSPPARNEKRWLPGWYNRLEAYANPLH